MNEELLEQLRWLLNLPVGTTAEEIATHLGKLIEQLRAGPAAAASAGFDLPGHLASLSAQIATPDPAQFVPVATLSALQGEHATLQGQVAALTAQINDGKMEQVIADGKAAGKIVPATEAWARDLGKKDLAALSAFITAAPVVVMPGETQTGGSKPAGSPADDDADAIAQAALSYQAEQAKAGNVITTVAAVAHVTKTKGA